MIIQKTLLPGIVAICLLFLTGIAKAQPGWEWGRVATGTDEAWLLAADDSYHVYAGVIAMDTATFGTTILPGTGLHAAWAKYDSAGHVLWAQSVNASSILFDITVVPSGNLLLYGSYTGTSMQIGTYTLTNAFGPSGNQYFLAKENAAGTVLWAVSDGNPGSEGDAFFGAPGDALSFGNVRTDESGNIFISGQFSASSIVVGGTTLTNAGAAGTSDVFVARYTAAGAPVWAASVGGDSSEQVMGLTVVPGDTAYITGIYRSGSLAFGSSVLSNPYSMPRAFIGKFSPAGVPLWGQGAGGRKGAGSVAIDHDPAGNVYMLGDFRDSSVSFSGVTMSRLLYYTYPFMATYLVKFAPGGAVVWGKTIDCYTDPVAGYSLAYTPCGRLWVSGSYVGSIVFAAGDTLMPVASDASFIACYDQDGNVVRSAGISAGGDDQNNIACDAAGNLYMVGDFEWPFRAGADSLQYTFSSGGGEEFFIAKYHNPADTFHAVADTTVCATTHSIVAPTGYDAYLWDNGTAAATRTITGPGTYWVQLTNSCSVTYDTMHIIFSGSPCPVGVPVTTNNAATLIIPNPATTEITLQAADGIYNTCVIINSLGQPVITRAVSAGSTVINISSLPPGIYYVRLTGAGDTHVERFVKE